MHANTWRRSCSFSERIIAAGGIAEDRGLSPHLILIKVILVAVGTALAVLDAA